MEGVGPGARHMKVRKMFYCFLHLSLPPSSSSFLLHENKLHFLNKLHILKNWSEKRKGSPRCAHPVALPHFPRPDTIHRYGHCPPFTKARPQQPLAAPLTPHPPRKIGSFYPASAFFQSILPLGGLLRRLQREGPVRQSVLLASRCMGPAHAPP